MRQSYNKLKVLSLFFALTFLTNGIKKPVKVASKPTPADATAMICSKFSISFLLCCIYKKRRHSTQLLIAVFNILAFGNFS